MKIVDQEQLRRAHQFLEPSGIALLVQSRLKSFKVILAGHEQHFALRHAQPRLVLAMAPSRCDLPQPAANAPATPGRSRRPRRRSSAPPRARDHSRAPRRTSRTMRTGACTAAGATGRALPRCARVGQRAHVLWNFVLQENFDRPELRLHRPAGAPRAGAAPAGAAARCATCEPARNSMAPFHSATSRSGSM